MRRYDALDYSNLDLDAVQMSRKSPGAFDFEWPTRLIFGGDTLDRLGVLMAGYGGHRALLVSDPGVSAVGHAARAVASLEAAGIAVFPFEEANENPTARDVAQVAEFARTHEADCIVGIGGGSAIDTAKGANFLISNGGRMEDYWGVGKARNPMLPVIAVPTTAGTGTETQSFALIVHEETRQKMACGDKKAMCKAAILDPKLTLTQPPRVTSATGIDAISHVVESWVSKRCNAISCMFGGQAWSCLSGAYDKVAVTPDDLEARSSMLIGASLAGAAIEHSMLGAAHSCANPLTARYETAHGVAVGLMLPHVVRFNAAVCGGQYRELLIRADIANPGDAGAHLANWIEARLESHALPKHLAEIGATEDDIPDLARAASEQWTAQFNPRRVSVEDFEQLYRAAF